jgi:hypothetical protein
LIPIRPIVSNECVIPAAFVAHEERTPVERAVKRWEDAALESVEGPVLEPGEPALVRSRESGEDGHEREEFGILGEQFDADRRDWCGWHTVGLF